MDQEQRRCVQAREALSAALDGEASEAGVVAAVRHVRLCSDCLTFVVGVVKTTRALRAGHRYGLRVAWPGADHARKETKGETDAQDAHDCSRGLRSRRWRRG